LQGMKLVAEEMPTPISTEFQRVVSEVSYGLPYDIAFSNMLRRNTGPDVNLVITAIEINLEVGGNLSEILDNISSIIRDRVRIQGQVASLTAMTRFSSMVLTILPFGLGGIIFLVNKEYISQLWTTTGGLIMLVLAIVLVVIGSFLLQRVAKIDV
jgi:tight adherence protein B